MTGLTCLVATLATGAGAAPPPPPDADAARRWALLLMLVTLLGVGLLVVVAAGWALRRGRRMRDEAQERTPTAMTDAWAEAGRRARGDLLGPVEPDEDKS